jgi:TolB-like protein/class 3 adenylate cyclase/Tfp pilus assembly protein PilF
MSEARVERRLAAILAADVAGYSRLIGEDEEGTLAALRAIRHELTDPKIAAHRGRIVKTTGDGLLVEFSSVVDALRCAGEVQAAMAERNADVPPDKRVEFRIGINVGDIVVEDGDIFGDGVNVAARLEALADPGGICVSARVQEDAAGRLDLAFDDLGEQNLKNIARSVRVYRVRSALTRSAISAPAPALALPDKPSIAVLPFQNMSGDPEQEYFVDGLVEDIITALSRVGWFFVIARNSSFTYKGKTVDVQQVGRELGVRYVLEGSVRKAGSRVRITGQLIDTANGAHIWADRFDGALDDIFDLQDQVASSVVGAIEPKLRSSEIARATHKPTESLDAYDLYLRGLAEFNKVTQEGYEAAFQLAQRSLAVDPSYAPAAAMAAWCRTYQTAQGWVRNTPDITAEAVRLAKQAIDTGRDNPDVLWMAGHTIGQFAGDHATASGALDRALTLNPNSANAWGAKGWTCLFLDQADAAVEAFEQAMRLTPLDPLRYVFEAGLARAHLTARRFDEAMRWVDRSIAEQPRFTVSLRIKVVLCELTGLSDEAREWLERLREWAPEMTIESFIAYAAKHYTPALRCLYVDALRRVGLPEK